MTVATVALSIALFFCMFAEYGFGAVVHRSKRSNEASDASGCGSKEIFCDGFLCLPKKQICDGYPHCLDGADEGSHCGKIICPRWQYLCPTANYCIPRSFICDGRNDCPQDAADESNCSTSAATTEDEDAPRVARNESEIARENEAILNMLAKIFESGARASNWSNATEKPSLVSTPSHLLHNHPSDVLTIRLPPGAKKVSVRLEFLLDPTKDDGN